MSKESRVDLVFNRRTYWGCALTLMLSAPAWAQDSLGLRTSLEPEASQGEKPADRIPKPETRRTRLPAMQPTRAQTTLSVKDPRTARDVQPIQTGLPDPAPLELTVRRKRPEEDPYAPLGIKSGGLFFLHSIQQDMGYDTNPSRVETGAKGSGLTRTEGALGLQSDWIRHELTGTVRGAYTAFTDAPRADRPDADGRINLRIDAARDTRIDAETRFRVDTERPGDPNLPVSVRNRPLDIGYGASLGATKTFNRLSIGLRGEVDRSNYGDAELNNGLSLSQADRNVAQYTARLRANYELTPGLIPFAEAVVDTRIHDRTIDDSGFRRDSNGLGFRLGSSFELTRLLTGEASFGYRQRDYDDNRLKTLQGPTADAALIWSASPITTLRLRAATDLDETTIPGSSGAVNRRITAELRHDFQRDLTAIASATFSQVDYRGIRLQEDGFAGSVKLDYKLSRSVILRTSFTHERLKSTQPGSDYTANVFLVGLRLQR